MPSSTKRAEPASTHAAKRAKPTASTHTAKSAKPAVKQTITRVPKWGRGLTSVVAAFEACDQEALRKALDAADPALLNHIPALPHDLSLDHPDAWRWFRDNCFFNASTEFGLGTRPLSLVSSAVYMLAYTWGKRHALARATKYHRDEWVSVFQTLIAHKNIDLNAYNPVVTYMPGRLGTPPQWRISRLTRTDGVMHAESVLVPQHYSLCTPDAASGPLPYFDDGMRPLDYACLIRDQERYTENGGYARNLVSILAQSANFAPTALDLCNLFLRALPDVSWNDDKHMRLFLDKSDFFKAMQRADLTAMHNAFVKLFHEGMCLQSPNYPVYWNRSVRYLRGCMMGRWKVLRRQQLLNFVRRVARGHILVSRWWADARERSYKPGGNGCTRARLSYEATAAAAGW